MRVEYKKEKTIITLDNKEERQEVFNALRFYECKFNPTFLYARTRRVSPHFSFKEILVFILIILPGILLIVSGQP